MGVKYLKISHKQADLTRFTWAHPCIHHKERFVLLWCSPISYKKQQESIRNKPFLLIKIHIATNAAWSMCLQLKRIRSTHDRDGCNMEANLLMLRHSRNRSHSEGRIIITDSLLRQFFPSNHVITTKRSSNDLRTRLICLCGGSVVILVSIIKLYCCNRTFPTVLVDGFAVRLRCLQQYSCKSSDWTFKLRANLHGTHTSDC